MYRERRTEKEEMLIPNDEGLTCRRKMKDGTRIKLIRNGCQPPNYLDDRAHRKRKRYNKDVQAPYRKRCINRYQNLVTLLLIPGKVRLGGKSSKRGDL